MENNKAVVLLSGGLDSATTLYLAKSKGYECFCLIFDYGQRNLREIESAKALAQSANCQAQVIKIDLPWKGSALLDKGMKIPARDNEIRGQLVTGIPSTYVPGRNIIFLSFALSFAEAIAAKAIFIGAHAQDYSGYPDCRPEFFAAFSQVISYGTKAGVEKETITVEIPLIDKNKAEIIRLGRSLGVPFELTWSCYEGKDVPCGKCDSCYFRAKGFAALGIRDTLETKAEALLESKLRVSPSKRMLGRISEVFDSVQGEGLYLGERQIFVRFFDCNLNCKFCDTKLESFTEYAAEELFEELKMYQNGFHSISFTGGEPLLQKDFLKDVVRLSSQAGYKNYLETNGTLPDELGEVIDYLDIVAMDLKLPSSTGLENFWDIHRRFLQVASQKEVFLKAVICQSTKADDLTEAINLIKEAAKYAVLVLQPNCYESPELLAGKLKAFKEMCLKENIATCVIPQMHKMAGIR